MNMNREEQSQKDKWRLWIAGRIEDIVKHPAVSRAMNGGESTPALEELISLRRSRRDVKRAKCNMREEVQAYGGNDPNAYDKGRIVQIPKMPGDRRLRAALILGGLPDDLRQMIEEVLQ